MHMVLKAITLPVVDKPSVHEATVAAIVAATAVMCQSKVIIRYACFELATDRPTAYR